MSDNLKTIYRAIALFQSKCPVVPKDSKGYNYKYADLVTIVETIKPYMAEFKLGYVQSIIQHSETNKIGIKTVLFEYESGESIECELYSDIVDGGNKMTKIQTLGSYITYLRRYSLSCMLGLVTDVDDDGASTGAATQKNTQKNEPPKNEPPKEIKVVISEEELALLFETFDLQKLQDAYKKYDLKTNEALNKHYQLVNWGLTATKEKIETRLNGDISNFTNKQIEYLELQISKK